MEDEARGLAIPQRGVQVPEARRDNIGEDTEEQGHVPEVEHLHIEHAAQDADKLLGRLDPRADDSQLAQARETLERADVFEEVVVEVQHAHVRHQPRKVRRERRQAARRELEIDDVVAGL